MILSSNFTLFGTLGPPRKPSNCAFVQRRIIAVQAPEAQVDIQPYITVKTSRVLCTPVTADRLPATNTQVAYIMASAASAFLPWPKELCRTRSLALRLS